MNLVVRSTMVLIAERTRPMMRSPSQWPGTARSFTSAGRSPITTSPRTCAPGLLRTRGRARAAHVRYAAAARRSLIAELLRRYLAQEATPTLAPVPGIDLDAYRARLIERFSNEYVADTVARLCAEGVDRTPIWLLPVVRNNLDAGGPVTLSAEIVASWARYAEDGAPVAVVVRLAEELIALA